jgi:hypothetical protein
MDTIGIIKNKIEHLTGFGMAKGMPSVLRHIEIAEEYFNRARIEREEDMFTDVIYRTNHAFEGILKEAYTILAEKNPKKITPNEIEKYLQNNNILRPRVMELFKNYRIEWRNPSTHDYQLTFTEQEAFLSIMSVTSFISILLDQMIEKRSFDLVKEKGSSSLESMKKYYEQNKDDPLSDIFPYVISGITREFINNISKEAEPTERQIMGMLSALFQALTPWIVFHEQPILEDGGGRIIPDFFIERKGEKIILEVKKYRTLTPEKMKLVNEQMLRYLRAANVETGIIIMIPSGNEITDKYDKTISGSIEEKQIVHIILKPKGN